MISLYIHIFLKNPWTVFTHNFLNSKAFFYGLDFFFICFIPEPESKSKFEIILEFEINFAGMVDNINTKEMEELMRIYFS